MGEGPHCLGVERLENAAARVSVSLEELRLATLEELGVTRLSSQLITGLLQLLLPDLPVLLPHANL